ncbi:hypothetical protein ACOMHN_064588 [Nucella lapillus]
MPQSAITHDHTYHKPLTKGIKKTKAKKKGPKHSFYYELKIPNTKGAQASGSTANTALSKELKKLQAVNEDDRTPLNWDLKKVDTRTKYDKRLFRFEPKNTKTRSKAAWSPTAENRTPKNNKDVGDDVNRDVKTSKTKLETSEGTTSKKTGNLETVCNENNTDCATQNEGDSKTPLSGPLKQYTMCIDRFDPTTLDLLQLLCSVQPPTLYSSLKGDQETLLTPQEDSSRVRLTRRLTDAIVKEQMEAERKLIIENKVKNNCEDGLKMMWMEEKGRGVVATKEFQEKDFVVEFKGELITAATASEREGLYEEDGHNGCYMYYFIHQGRRLCMDATEETDRLGRLVNHSRRGNLKAVLVIAENCPHVVFLADRSIQAGEEVTVDYGDRSPTSLKYHPWLRE